MRDLNARHHDFDAETGPYGRKKEKTFGFVVRDRAFRITVEIPLRIHDCLCEGEYQRIMSNVHDRALTYLRNAADGRVLHLAETQAIIDQKVAKDLKEQIYERFLDYQERAGNAAWEVPPSLQSPLTL